MYISTDAKEGLFHVRTCLSKLVTSGFFPVGSLACLDIGFSVTCPDLGLDHLSHANKNDRKISSSSGQLVRLCLMTFP